MIALAKFATLFVIFSRKHLPNVVLQRDINENAFIDEEETKRTITIYEYLKKVNTNVLELRTFIFWSKRPYGH